MRHEGDYFLQHIDVDETLLEDSERYAASTSAQRFTVCAYGATIEAATTALRRKIFELAMNPSKRRKGVEMVMPPGLGPFGDLA